MSDQREKAAEERKFINDALEVFISFANLVFRSSRESQPELDDINSPRAPAEDSFRANGDQDGVTPEFFTPHPAAQYRALREEDYYQDE